MCQFSEKPLTDERTNKHSWNYKTYRVKGVGPKNRGLELVSLTHFRMIFEEKHFSCYILLIDQIALSDFMI